MSKKKDLKRSLAARRGHLTRELKKPGAIDKVALGLANAQVTVFARLVALQRARLEAYPPEDKAALHDWLLDYDTLWAASPGIVEDSKTLGDLIPTVEKCKEIAEGPLQDLHDRAAELGAKVTLADKGRVQTWRGFQKVLREIGS